MCEKKSDLGQNIYNIKAIFQSFSTNSKNSAIYFLKLVNIIYLPDVVVPLQPCQRWV